MTKRSLHSLKALLEAALFLLPACGSAATLSKEQAIKLANTVAKKQGVDLLQFAAPTAYYEPEYKRNEWFICYRALAYPQAKVAAFYVILNDTASTENATLTIGKCK